MSNVQMIAAWGNSGAGKTTFAIALASQIAKYQKNTVIISTNTNEPLVPVLLPRMETTGSQSIGQLLSTPMRDINALKGYLHIHPQSEHIGIIGMVSGNTPITYDEAKQEQIKQLIWLLNDSPFDYVVMDCESNPIKDTLTYWALQTSEYVVRLLTPDVRGIEFERSQMGWMASRSNMNTNRHIRIFSPAHSYSPIAEAAEVSGTAQYTLPFSTGVYNKSLAGEPVANLSDREGIEYEKTVRQIAERILQNEPNTL